MEQREKLIELLKEALENHVCGDCESFTECEECSARCEADYLLANGVVVPVRCEDCKYFDGEPGQPNIQCSQMHEDDFCSYGVRKGGDE